MLLRYRWHRISIPRGIQIESAIVNYESPNDGIFIRSQLSDGSAGFRFHWESSVTVSRIGPSGDVLIETIPSTNSTEFCLSPLKDQKILIRFVEPGRNIRPLLTAMEKSVGLGFSCAPIELGKSPPLSILNHVDEARLIGLKIRNVVINKKIVGRMEFASKSGFIDSDLGRISKLEQSRDQAVYDLFYKGVRGQLSYTASGLVRIGGALTPRILNFVEQDIRRLAIRK